MSRTFRFNGWDVNPAEWDKPYKATGDHGSHFFSVIPKKVLKTDTKRLNRRNNREAIRDILATGSENATFTPHNKVLSSREYEIFN